MFAQLTGFISKAFSIKSKTKWVDKGVYYDDHIEAQLMAAFDAEADAWIAEQQARRERDAAIRAEFAELTFEERSKAWEHLCHAAMQGQVEYEYFYIIWLDSYRRLNQVRH